MQVKEGAIIAGLHPSMRRAMAYADTIWTEAGEELVVTAGLDGGHSAGSLHYCGRAVDLRTRYFSPEVQVQVASSLRRELGRHQYYDVIMHSTHIHVEYDHPRWK